jgi:hypothetical protein
METLKTANCSSENFLPSKRRAFPIARSACRQNACCKISFSVGVPKIMRRISTLRNCRIVRSHSKRLLTKESRCSSNWTSSIKSRTQAHSSGVMLSWGKSSRVVFITFNNASFGRVGQLGRFVCFSRNELIVPFQTFSPIRDSSFQSTSDGHADRCRASRNGAGLR